MALMPRGRMGPPLRSFAADAHDCIMVRVLGPTEYKVVARLIRARKRAPPLIVIPTAPSVPSCSKLSRYGLARAKHIERLVRRPTLTAPCARRPWPCCGSGRRNGLSDRTKKLTKEDMRCTAELLDKRSPIQGLYKKHGPLALIGSRTKL